MPFLIRWKSADSSVTIRAQRVVASPFIDSHVRLQGVKGLNDGDHPDIEVHTIDINKGEIEWIVEGITKNDLKQEQAKQQPVQTVKTEPETEPDPEPEPEPEPPKKSSNRTRERRARRTRTR